jgi:hypothetical protein
VIASALFKKLLFFLGALTPFLLLVVPHIDLVPIWDGALYAKSILSAVDNRFDLGALNIAGHPGIGSLLVPALIAKWSGGQLWGLHLGNIILGSIAVLSFAAIVNRLFVELAIFERLAISSMFSALPVVAASAVNPNLDFGTLVFFLLFLSLLLYQRFWLAAIAGGMLVLAKESGVVVWVITSTAYLLSQVILRRTASREKFLALLKVIPAFLSILALVAYAVIRLKHGQPVMWGAFSTQGGAGLHKLMWPSLHNPVYQTYMAQIFSLNFMWVVTLIVGLGMVLSVLGKIILGCRSKAPLRRNLIFLLLVPLVLSLTAVRTFTNMRYLLPIFPVLVLAYAHILNGIVRYMPARILILSVTFGLFLVSAFRTIDPISSRIFGTFAFGRHPILNMTSITGECCGRGRDQLVYNLEFANFNRLINQVFAGLDRSGFQPIALAELADWYFIERMTLESPPRRALSGPNTTATPIVSANVVSEANPPKNIFWLNLPIIDGSAEFERVKTRYSVVSEKVFEYDGYSLSGYFMVLDG